MALNSACADEIEQLCDEEGRSNVNEDFVLPLHAHAMCRPEESVVKMQVQYVSSDTKMPGVFRRGNYTLLDEIPCFGRGTRMLDAEL